MDELGIGAGMAALAFWGFISAVVLGTIWDNARKRESQHETVRRLVESGKEMDDETIDKLVSLNSTGSSRLDRDFYVTALWILPCSVGLVVFGLILGSKVPDALYPIVGAGALTACLGIGFLIAAKIVSRWYE